jgi:hypothetical protein
LSTGVHEVPFVVTANAVNKQVVWVLAAQISSRHSNQFVLLIVAVDDIQPHIVAFAVLVSFLLGVAVVDCAESLDVSATGTENVAFKERLGYWIWTSDGSFRWKMRETKRICDKASD